jgi:uncharacterized RDD family membrane protein YckC
LHRRLASLLYEALLLFGVLWLAGFFVVLFEQQFEAPVSRTVYQVFLVIAAGIYFVSQWSRGKTLPMKTWHLKLISGMGGSPSPAQATARYIAALTGVGLFGIAFWWAIFDPERQFLHDRIVGTRIVLS